MLNLIINLNKKNMGIFLEVITAFAGASLIVIMALTVAYMLKVLKDVSFWRLKNKLFGWDYVYIVRYVNEIGIYARVRKSPSGMIYCKGKDGRCLEIHYETDVKWLTCKPEKHLFDNDNFIKEQNDKFNKSL